MIKHRKTTEITHREICRAVAKIGAYLRLGDREKAKEWAAQLVQYLILLNLYPAHKVAKEGREKEDKSA